MLFADGEYSPERRRDHCQKDFYRWSAMRRGHWRLGMGHGSKREGFQQVSGENWRGVVVLDLGYIVLGLGEVQGWSDGARNLWSL